MGQIRTIDNGDTRVITVDATSGDLTVTLATGFSRTLVSRVDASAHTVTIRPFPHKSLDGVKDATTTVPASGRRAFLRFKGGWSSTDNAAYFSELFLDEDSNLTDTVSAASARSALGLGAAATKSMAQIAADTDVTGMVDGKISTERTSERAHQSTTYARLDQTPSLEELERTFFISASVSGTTTVRLGPVSVAQRVGALLVASSAAVSLDADNYWTIALMRYRGAQVVKVTEMTTKTVTGAAITADHGWPFDVAEWPATLRYLRRGDVLALRFTATGSPTTLTDVTATVRYEPNVPLTVVDTFTRADSAVTLGSAETGQVWIPQVGIWGVSGGKAYLANQNGDPNRHYALIDAGTSDVTISTVVTAQISASGLAIRMTGTGNANSNCITCGRSGLYRIDNGSITALATWTAMVENDVMTIGCVGSAIKVWQNGAQVGSVTDTKNLTETKHGLRISADSLVRFDEVEMVY